MVVTRDRCELLRRSLEAVLDQTRGPDGVIVVDNASGDGTREMLVREFPDVSLVALTTNEGATGGFCEGIAHALAGDADWLWLLDDDAFPRPHALEELVGALDRTPVGRDPSLLAGRVEWHDGEPHPMNRPTVRHRDAAELIEAVRAGLLPLRATTWVSLLLSRVAVERHGMPMRHFFYQADDIEYTARLLREGIGYFVPTSVVEHRTPGRQTATSDARRFYFHVRNNLFMLRGTAWTAQEKPGLAWALARSAGEYLRANRWRPAAVRTLARALRAGLTQPWDGGRGAGRAPVAGAPPG